MIRRDTRFNRCRTIPTGTRLSSSRSRSKWRTLRGLMKCWTQSYMMNCRRYTTLGSCSWWPTCRHYSQLKKSSILKHPRWDHSRIQKVEAEAKYFLQVFSELEAVVDKLAKEVQKGTLPRKTFPKPAPITNNSINHMNGSQNSTL